MLSNYNKLLFLKHALCLVNRKGSLYINYFLFEGNKRCNGSAKVVECYSDPCLNSHCPNFDNALCIPNHCGECSAHYYNSTGHDITMICSKQK